MTPNVFGQWVETESLTIDLTKHLNSKRKASDKELIQKLKLIHSSAFLEIKNLKLVHRYFPHLSETFQIIKLIWICF